jgi:hypothetical protein
MWSCSDHISEKIITWILNQYVRRRGCAKLPNVVSENEGLWKSFQSWRPHTAQLQTYDSGIASIFHVPTEDAREVSINYVGVLKDIMKLDYGPLHTHVNLMKCEWMKRVDNRGNNTYAQDEAGFLLVNFRHKLPRIADPFIFPTQATQVFFSDD